MRGRKPKPTALKMFEGNPGRRPLNQNEARPTVEIPDCPRHLDDEAKAEWEWITPRLELHGLLTQIDRAALAAYCQVYSRWVNAEEKLKVSGPVVKNQTTGAVYQNPYLAVANRALKQMREFLTEFGMTPSSRSRVWAKPLRSAATEAKRRKYGSG